MTDMATILREAPVTNGFIDRYLDLGTGEDKVAWLGKNGGMFVRDIVFPLFGQRPNLRTSEACWTNVRGEDPMDRGLGLMIFGDHHRFLPTPGWGDRKWPAVRRVDEKLRWDPYLRGVLGDDGMERVELVASRLSDFSEEICDALGAPSLAVLSIGGIRVEEIT